MRNYLSFGGGVNSVALHLLLLEQGVDFESVFVHHGTDWPETYQYLAGFQWWLKANGHKHITILRPKVKTNDGLFFSNLYDYYHHKRTFPVKMTRACTDKFKIQPIYKYVKTPCFMMIGIDSGEAQRAKISYTERVENRFPLIENNIDRALCVSIIRRYRLPVPMKSGCFVCPFQKKSEFKKLRKLHPDFFCKAIQLENRYISRRKEENKKPIYISGVSTLGQYVDEKQLTLLAEDAYPPCQCGL